MAKFGKLGRHKGSGLYFCRIDGKPKYFGNRNTTEQEADAMRSALMVEATIRDASQEENDRQSTIGALSELYMRETAKDGCDKNRTDKERYLRLFMAEYGSFTPLGVRPHMIDEWSRRQKEWNDTTRGNCLKRLSAMFNWLVNNEYLSRNPVKAVKRPVPLVRGEEYIVSPVEYETLLDACLPRHKPILQILWESGCRPSELLGALADEYDGTQHAILKKKHKTSGKGKRRTVILTPTADEIVQERVAAVGTGLLFTSTHGRKIGVDVFNQYLCRLAERCGITHPFCQYSFRHTFAVRHLERGIALHVVAAWMGNTVAVCERHYAHTLERVRTTRHMMTDPPA